VDADVENKRINQLIILDWELAKTGPAATDVGQFAAESYMLQKLTPRSAGGALLRSFLTKYKSVISASIKGQKISATLFDPQGIVACIAAHAAVWGSLVSWADAETTRATVETALGLCKHAMTGDLQDIKDTELSVLMD
jgi:thiamine kinase-like enzyme